MIKEFRNEHSYLSNFHPCLIKVRDLTFTSTEACFQACKCTNPADRNKFVGISPKEAKSLGRKVTLRPDWDGVKVDCMYKTLKLKFKDPELKAKLLATGSEELQEGNYWNDCFWGIDLKTGKGLNMLGKLLMKLRAELS